jgi:hypothetical protein
MQTFCHFQSEGAGESEKKPPVHSALSALMKEKKPISPFLRAKHGAAVTAAGEGGSGLNKHIRFDETGEPVKENGDATKEEENNDEEVKMNGATEDADTKTADSSDESKSSSKVQNGHNGSVTSDSGTAAATKENGLAKGGEEKENQDLNGLEKES